MRSAIVLALAASLAGCGLANGLTEGEIESPLNDVFGGGEGEGEGEGEGGLELGDECADSEGCLLSELVCDINEEGLGTCQLPSVWDWCDEADPLGDREEGGPILYDPAIVDEVVVCVDVDVDYYDPDDDFPSDDETLLSSLNVRTNGNGGVTAADVAEEIIERQGDGTAGYFIVRVCSTTLPTIVALSVQDESDNRSNAACG